MEKTANRSFVSLDRAPVGHRLTATEIIGGVECLVVLERDSSGRYREISCRPAPQPCPAAVQ